MYESDDAIVNVPDPQALIKEILLNSITSRWVVRLMQAIMTLCIGPTRTTPERLADHGLISRKGGGFRPASQSLAGPLD
jgi:hypothetical protein